MIIENDEVKILVLPKNEFLSSIAQAICFMRVPRGIEVCTSAQGEHNEH